jgi:hypothetical protein
MGGCTHHAQTCTMAERLLLRCTALNTYKPTIHT